jgi:hypothetical protein
MAMVIVDLPIKNGWIFHGYVSLPEGILETLFYLFCGRCSRDSNNSCHGGAVQRRGVEMAGPRDFSYTWLAGKSLNSKEV